jgi:capsular polysaccharide biosynthesis protein
VVNDGELEHFFANQGFDCLELDNVSFSEQVRIFASCETLVSIHGAGLTNVLFMPKGSNVIEFYPRGFTEKDYFNACYRRLSGALGIGHRFLFCERANKARPFNLHEDDIRVDEGAMKEVINSIE